jgi:toxin FitB
LESSFFCQEWLDRDLPDWFGGRISTVDRSIADRWGVFRAEARKKVRPLSVVDGLLTATAFEHGLTLVSRNESDFRVLGLAVLNPWES